MKSTNKQHRWLIFLASEELTKIILKLLILFWTFWFWQISSLVHSFLFSISCRVFSSVMSKIIFSNYPGQIQQLKISNQLTINLLENFFWDFYIYDFKPLRSITLIQPSYMTLGSFAYIVRYFERLEHLSIDSNSYPDKIASPPIHIYTTNESLSWLLISLSEVKWI